MRPTFRWLSSFAVAAFLLALPLATASAQTSVSVLGLTSLEGDDEFARNFTGALRHAASQVEGWTVSDRDVALSQMELTHDCSSSDAGCLTQIATSIGSARVIYGTIQRAAIGTRYEFQISLYLFNAESGEVEERVTDNVSSSDTDIDALREPARRMVRALSAATSPGTVRVTGTPNVEVRIDGAVVGRTDAGGTYVSDPIPPGDHTVRMGDSDQTVHVAGAETLAAFAVVEGGGGGSVLPWVGVGLLGVAAVSLGVSIFAMARLDSLSSNPDYIAFRQSVGAMDRTATNVCQNGYFSTASFGMTVGQSTCSEGSTMEALQYAFLGVAVAAAGTGIALIVVGAGEGNSTSPDTANLGNGLRLRLSPSVSPERAYLGATLEF